MKERKRKRFIEQNFTIAFDIEKYDTNKNC